MTGFPPQIFRVQRFCIHDGPGIRTTLFFSGCPLSCRWCHNPESQGPVPDRADLGTLVPEVMALVEKDLVFYEESGGGVTFSGGEPLGQPDLVKALALACRERQIHTCLDTSGFAPWPVLAAIANAVDLIHYDIKTVAPGRHQDLCGVPSGQILANLEALGREARPVTLRFPLVPGCTDSRQNLTQMIEFLTTRTPFRTIHILPFHHTAQGKYQILKQEDPMAGTLPPAAEKTAAVAALFQSHGFETLIGG